MHANVVHFGVWANALLAFADTGRSLGFYALILHSKCAPFDPECLS